MATEQDYSASVKAANDFHKKLKDSDEDGLHRIAHRAAGALLDVCGEILSRQPGFTGSSQAEVFGTAMLIANHVIDDSNEEDA